MARVIEDFKRLGYIDDEKNRQYYIDLLLKRGYGENYISRFLWRKGFKGEIARLDVEKEGLIEKWFIKKTKGLTELDKKTLQKVVYYLQSKGFYLKDIFDFLRKRGLYERE